MLAQVRKTNGLKHQRFANWAPINALTSTSLAESAS